MSDSKIQVKVGIVEFSGEGNQDWLAMQLDKILDKVPELLKIEVTGTANNQNKKNSTEQNANHASGHSSLNTKMSLLNIAGKLACKTGPDLAVAAAAYLHFTEDKPVFNREELSSTMKKANGYYKDGMMGNLTKILTKLERDGDFTKSSNNYSIQAQKLSELNATLFNK